MMLGSVCYLPTQYAITTFLRTLAAFEKYTYTYSFIIGFNYSDQSDQTMDFIIYFLGL